MSLLLAAGSGSGPLSITGAGAIPSEELVGQPTVSNQSEQPAFVGIPRYRRRASFVPSIVGRVRLPTLSLRLTTEPVLARGTAIVTLPKTAAKLETHPVTQTGDVDLENLLLLGAAARLTPIEWALTLDALRPSGPGKPTGVRVSVFRE